MRTCHPKNSGFVKTEDGKSYFVTLRFTKEQFSWIKQASEMYTGGCTCDLVGNLFWDKFEELTKEIATSTSDDTAAH